MGRAAAESLLALAVGLLVGRLAWTVLAPADAAAEVSDAQPEAQWAAGDEVRPGATSILTASNPFDPSTRADLTDGDEPAETTLDLRLAGLRSVAGNAAASSAILDFPDGTQKRVAPGDELMPGVLLVNVTSDSVHLSRNGGIETLRLRPAGPSFSQPAPAVTMASASTSIAAAPQAAEVDLSPAALVADTVLTPEFRDDRVSGYRVSPRGNGAFEAAGLQSGDMILRVNSQSIEGLRPEQISQSVATGKDVQLDVVRQGAIVRLTIAPRSQFTQ